MVPVWRALTFFPLFMGGCCNPPGPEVSKKFLRERAAVEAAISQRGAVVDLSEPVYEYHAPGEPCPESLGCCNTGWCAGIFVPDRDTPLAGGHTLTREEVALHEYVHRALLDLGWQPATEEHPRIFWDVLWSATKLNNAP